MSNWLWFVWGLLALGLAWDIARRVVATMRLNQAVHDEVAQLKRDLERQHEVQQAILSRLTAQSAPTANRVPRIGR